MNKVMLVGTYSSLNKGDFAMHQALIKEISKRIEDIDFTIFSPFPELDYARYSHYFSDQKIGIENENLRHPLNAINSNLQVYLGNKNLFKDYGTIIDVSGDAIGESYSIQNTFYRIFYLNLYKNLNKKMILSPQSVGPFNYSKLFFKKIFNHAEKIYVRDPLSYRYLEDFELKNISMTGDLAFLLDKKADDLNKNYIEKIKDIDGIKIGLNLSYLLGNYLKKSNMNIDMVDLGTKLCEGIYSKFDGFKNYIIFIPHVFGPEEDKNDCKIGKLIYENLSDRLKERFILVDNEMDHEELKAIISEMDMFIGARMHACIGAISLGKPFLNIAYSDKSKGLISQSIGLPELCIDIRDMKNQNDIINKILENLEYIHNNKKNIEDILSIKGIEFKTKVEQSINEICELIKEK